MISNNLDLGVIKFPRYGYITRVPYQGRRRCICGAYPGDFHARGCKEEICPICFKKMGKKKHLFCTQELSDSEKNALS